jgi:hypothetical protein
MQCNWAWATDVTVQYTYLFGETVADWTDAPTAAQISSLNTEVIGPWTDAAIASRVTALAAEVLGPVGEGTNTTAASVFVEVIHDMKALATSSVPILMACT